MTRQRTLGCDGHRITLAILSFASILFAGVALAQEAQPVRGEDLIEVPAITDGFSVHNLFQSNMVLQRDKPIFVWGWATPGQQVTVTFGKQTNSVTASENRSWRVELPPFEASAQPREMIVACNEKKITLHNVLVGDVWLLGGQSNMEHPISRVEDGDLEIVSANYQNIRSLTVPAQNGPDDKKGFPRLYEWSDWNKRHFRKGNWLATTPETVRELSAIGYVFARRIHQASQIPIGVIDVSRGGTTVETWTPDAVLRKIDTPEVNSWLAEWDQRVVEFDPQRDLEDRVKRHHQWVENMKKQGREIPADRNVPSDLRPGPAMDQNRPGNCYASMITPIAGLQVKGAIWHQGFNNALQPNGHVMYYQIFPKMIEAWRAAFNDPSLPFGIISLCTAGAPQNLDNYVEMMANEGVYIRAVQYQTYRDLVQAGDENVGFASSYDMRRSWYHPGLKVPVGERIARWALATQCDMDIPWAPPEVKEKKVQEGKIILTFNVQVGGLRDWPIEGFAIAGQDRRFQPAQAEHLETGKDRNNRPTYDRRTLVLGSPLVPEPIHYRYAWGRNPMANVTITDGRYGRAPLPTLRSDDWRLTEIPVILGPDLDHRQRVGQLRKMLKEADLERRLTESQQLLGELEKKSN